MALAGRTPTEATTVAVRPLAPADAPAVAELSRDARFASLRYLALFGFDIAAQEQADRVARHLAGDGLHVVATVDGEVVGQATARPVADLTEHFGIVFHELGPLLTADLPDVSRRNAVAAMLGALRTGLDGDEPGVVTLRVEGDDLEALAGAEDAGFRVRETSVTFVNDLERCHLNGGAEVDDEHVRVHRFDQDGELPASERELMIEGAWQVNLDHYHADPRLPDALCDGLYRRVVERGVRGVGADVVVRRYLDDQLIGFGTWRRWDDLEAYGVALTGSSFGFRIAGAPAGKQSEVAAMVCNRSLVGERLLEWSTQAQNYAMVNMMCRQPSIRLVRTSYVLHGWTDEA